MKEKTGDPHNQNESMATRPKKERTLLEKYEIPVEHLDFTYVQNCTDVKEVERILKILRCGEEGYFPELERCVVNRLEELNPRSRYLRVQVPILHSDCLNKIELDELKKDFLNWVDDIEDANEKEKKELSKNIFEQDFEMPDIPIRGSQKVIKEKQTNTLIRNENPDKIKSWEYDKWDKFDVDKELTKLDIETMQCEEWDKSLDKKKLEKEQQLVAKLMKNEDLHEKEKKKKTIFSHVQSTLSCSPVVANKTVELIPELEDAPIEYLANLSSRGKINSTISPKSNVTKSTGKSTDTHFGDPVNDALKLNNLLASCSKSTEKSVKSSTAAANNFCRDPQKKSFIEEIPETLKEKPKRRFKIHIDDINIA